jgi:hypothetical protein
MNKQLDGIFGMLDWILKKPNLDYDFNNEMPSTFMLMRWLSMSSKESSKIINETVNRWHSNPKLYSDISIISKFLRIILQKNTKRLFYLKKKTKKKTIKGDEDTQEHLYRECSKKEIINQKRLLEELQLSSK